MSVAAEPAAGSLTLSQGYSSVASQRAARSANTVSASSRARARSASCSGVSGNDMTFSSTPVLDDEVEVGANRDARAPGGQTGHQIVGHGRKRRGAADRLRRFGITDW